MAIRIRRGNQVDFEKNKLVQGELAIVLDKGELYFCYGAGDIRRLQTREDLIELLNTNPETYAALEGVLGELSEAPEEVLAILTNFMDIEEIIENAELATEQANDISDDLEQKIADDYFRGEKGEKGDRGVNWKGVYSSATPYVENDGVSFNGSSYICISETQGNAPTNTNYWDILSAKGADGTGDMLVSVYDPQGKAQDMFEYTDQEVGEVVQTLNEHLEDNVAHGVDTKIPKSLATAANQFLVSSGAGSWVIKTVAQIKTLLGLKSAAYTESSAYATATQGTKADNALPKTGGTMTGILTAQSNTSYTVRQVRNIILSTTDADLGTMQNGDIWIKYK
jgi:hypothetical protein